jgi:hypothetical protein
MPAYETFEILDDGRVIGSLVIQHVKGKSYSSSMTCCMSPANWAGQLHPHSYMHAPTEIPSRLRLLSPNIEVRSISYVKESTKRTYYR